MDAHNEKFWLLRERIRLAESAWPNTDTRVYLTEILQLTAELIGLNAETTVRHELTSISTKSVSVVQVNHGESPTAVMEARALINNIEHCEVKKQIGLARPKTKIKFWKEGGERFAGKINPGGVNYAILSRSSSVSLSRRRKSNTLSRSLSARSCSSNVTCKPVGEKHVKIFEDTLSPRERMVKIRELFRSMDMNADMVVDWHEFNQIVTLNSGINVDDALKLFKEFDINSSGKISLNELDSHIMHLTFLDAKVRFLSIAGKDKVINRKEWKQFCEEQNISVRKQKKIWSRMDTDGSGRVTYREFDDYVNLELTNGVLDSWFASS